jgi:hypothetical protein
MICAIMPARCVFLCVAYPTSLGVVCPHAFDQQLTCVIVLQVKKLGENSDIVYLSYQGKLGVCARDLCLLRAWHECPDGSTLLVARSIECDDVPRVAGKVRAECHDCAYMVTPAKDGCIFSYVIQLDMKGYVPLFFSNLIQTQHPLIISMLRRHLEGGNGQ